MVVGQQPAVPPSTSLRDLEGARVLELGDLVSVGFCGKLLADLGARVIKIEDPQRGDMAREFGPYRHDLPDREASGLFLYLHANKLGVTLNLQTPTGRRLFRELVRRADVLVENLPPGFLEKLGLDYPVLRPINPNLVMVSISTFGKSGRYAGYKGYDLTSWHGSGAGHRYLGYPDREPLRGAWYHASHWGAITGAGAAVLGLLARDVIGAGQLIDISEAETLAQLLLAVEVSKFFQDGETQSRAGGELTGFRPCKDGWLSIATVAPHQWDGLVRAMGSPDWALDPKYAGPGHARRPYMQEINEKMAPWLMSHGKEELFALLQSHSTPSGPVYSVADLYYNEHLRARGYFVEMEHPAAGPLRVPGPPFRTSGEDPWRIDLPAPSLGQDNLQVYCGLLGLDKSDLSDLRRAGVI